MFPLVHNNRQSLQAYHQLLALGQPAGYPSLTMFAPRQRPQFPGLRSPFVGPQMTPYSFLRGARPQMPRFRRPMLTRYPYGFNFNQPPRGLPFKTQFVS